jgi:DNA-binding CsgD family transcriptional regulator
MKSFIVFFLCLLATLCGIIQLSNAQSTPPPRSETDKILRAGQQFLMAGHLKKTKEQIITVQKKYKQLPPPEKVAFWVLNANFFDKTYKIDSALWAYQNALEAANLMPIDEPSTFHLHLSMGHFYLHLGIPDVAIFSFEKAIQIAKNDLKDMPKLDARVGLVRAYLDLKQPKLAQKKVREYFDLVQKMGIKEANILMHYWTGVCYEALRQSDSAQYYFRKINLLPLEHSRDNNLKNRALERIVEFLLQEKKYAEAEKEWQKIRLKPNDFTLNKKILQAKILAKTNQKTAIKPILDTITAVFIAETKQTQITREIKQWKKIYRESLKLYQLLGNQADTKAYQAFFTPILDSLQIINDKSQNLILRKLSIYTAQYYDQQRQIRDSHERFMNFVIVGSIFILLCLLVGSWQYYRRRIENQRQDIEFKTAEAIIMQYEIEEAKRKEHQLKKEIELQKADITDLALENTFKNKQAQELLLELKDIKGELRLHEKNNQTLDNLIKDLRNRINANERRDMLLANIDKVNRDFYERLSQISQDLTQTEKEFCGLLRLQLSSKEIAILRNITPKAVKMARYRLRKKLNLPSDEDMYAFIAEV